VFSLDMKVVLLSPYIRIVALMWVVEVHPGSLWGTD